MSVPSEAAMTDEEKQVLCRRCAPFLEHTVSCVKYSNDIKRLTINIMEGAGDRDVLMTQLLDAQAEFNSAMLTEQIGMTQTLALMNGPMTVDDVDTWIAKSTKRHRLAARAKREEKEAS